MCLKDNSLVFFLYVYFIDINRANIPYYKNYQEQFIPSFKCLYILIRYVFKKFKFFNLLFKIHKFKNLKTIYRV